MFRWVRLAAVGAVIVSLLALGVGIGLFLVANNSWTPVEVPPWLTGLFGNPQLDLWIPALIAGWLVSGLAVCGLLIGSMYYVWRRRQYESLIHRLESELTELRNLPFTAPAPLEDLPEDPDAEAAALMSQTSHGERRGEQS